MGVCKVRVLANRFTVVRNRFGDLSHMSEGVSKVILSDRVEWH